MLLTKDTLHSATGGETTAHGINPHSLTFTPSPFPPLTLSPLHSPPHSYTHRYLLLSRAFNTWRLFVAITKQVQTILVPAPVHFHSCSHPCTLPHTHTPHPHTLTPSPWVRGYVSMSLVLRRVFSIYQSICLSDSVIKLPTKYKDDPCVGRRLKLHRTALCEGDDGNIGFKYRLFPALVLEILPGGRNCGRRNATTAPHRSLPQLVCSRRERERTEPLSLQS